MKTRILRRIIAIISVMVFAVIVTSFHANIGNAASDVWSTPINLSNGTTTPDFSSSSIAVDNSGKIYVVWSENGQVFITMWNGSWSNPVSINAGAVGPHSIATDKLGRLHLIYFVPGSFESTALYYRAFDGASWTSPVPISGQIMCNIQWPSITVDSSNNPRVVCPSSISGNDSTLYYFAWDGQSWTLPQALTSGGYPYQPRIAVDNAGIAHVVWPDLNHALYYQRQEGQSWSSPIVLSDGVGDPDIAADGAGNIHVVYFGGHDIFYKIWNGSTWSAPTNISNNSWCSSVTPSLAVDSKNNVHVVYGGCDGNGDIFYQKWDGTSWTSPTNISQNNTESLRPAIAVASDGTGHVVWTNQTPSLVFDIFYSTNALPTYSISGQVSDIGGGPLAGVTVSAGGNLNTTTLSDGSYKLSGLTAGTYTLTPSLNGYTFSPLSSPPITVSPNAMQNFVGIPDTGIPEFHVPTGLAIEPSLAADPLNSLHAVIGYNSGNLSLGSECAWAETTDGGKSWTIDGLPRPKDFNADGGDPWVRYAPDGTLYYSCLGENTSNFTKGVFVAVALPHDGKGGQAGELGKPAHGYVRTVVSDLAIYVGFDDHPSLTILRKSDGTNVVVVCWSSFVGPAVNPFTGFRTWNVFSSYSTNKGKTWSSSNRIAASDSNTCIAGGGVSGSGTPTVAIGWWSTPLVGGQQLYLRTSTDGVNWSKRVDLWSTADNPNLSTTDMVESPPYVMTASKSNGALRAVLQVRTNKGSQVMIQDQDNGWGKSTQVGDFGQETFLPAIGNGCADVIGFYESTQGWNGTIDSPFRYLMWQNKGGTWNHFFYSGADSLGRNGVIENPPRFNLPRIGDYTALDCSKGVAWGAWTDNRTGQDEIWGVRIPVP